jgi:hypothetical protein
VDRSAIKDAFPACRRFKNDYFIWYPSSAVPGFRFNVQVINGIQNFKNRALKGICRQKRLEDAMSMYFYDETDDWPEYDIVKLDIHRLENEYLESRKLLKEAESASMSDPANNDLKAKVDELKIKMKEIENRLAASMSMYL